LAKSIVRDGEGATKFVEITVDGASEQDNISVATTVAQSPLVKTALFASDPNWGRILAAVGRAPVAALRIEEISIWLGDYQIVDKGELVVPYDESVAAQIMEKSDIELKIRIGTEGNTVQVWTCDFSYDYVRINAEYRT
jgi:glutamate N-acetyltransferase/amino-acid N-acetyltransferase